MAKPTGKLSQQVIDRYFDEHLPYRTRIMLAHYKMTRRSWTADRGPVSWLEACFEASLITGRMYLNLLRVGAKRDGSALTVIGDRELDDIDVQDLCGKPLDPTRLSQPDYDLLLAFILMANKASAHLTAPGNYHPDIAHPAIFRIHHYLNVNLYDAAGRTGLEPLS